MIGTASARSDVDVAVPIGGTIVVETADGQDDGYASVRDAAIELAIASGGSLVLVDRSTASWFTDPFPSGPMTADVDGPRGGRPIEAGELFALGRSSLSRQLLAAQARGIRATAWLPLRFGASAMAEAVVAVDGDLVLLRAHRGGGLRERILKDRVRDHEEALSVPVRTVEGDSHPTPGRAARLAVAHADARGSR